LKDEMSETRKDIKDRREILDSRMENQHKDLHIKIRSTSDSLWTAVREKLSVRVALAFITAFTLAYVIGVATVYRATVSNKLLMHQMETKLMLEMKDLSHEIKDLKRHITTTSNNSKR
jgi:hypothetical protein